MADLWAAAVLSDDQFIPALIGLALMLLFQVATFVVLVTGGRR